MKEALRKLLKLQDDHLLHFEKVYGGDICESFSVTLASPENAERLAKTSTSFKLYITPRMPSDGLLSEHQNNLTNV
jgi:hypothetical protein